MPRNVIPKKNPLDERLILAILTGTTFGVRAFYSLERRGVHPFVRIRRATTGWSNTLAWILVTRTTLPMTLGPPRFKLIRKIRPTRFKKDGT